MSLAEAVHNLEEQFSNLQDLLKEAIDAVESLAAILDGVVRDVNELREAKDEQS